MISNAYFIHYFKNGLMTCILFHEQIKVRLRHYINVENHCLVIDLCILILLLYFQAPQINKLIGNNDIALYNIESIYAGKPRVVVIIIIIIIIVIIIIIFVVVMPLCQGLLLQVS